MNDETLADSTLHDETRHDPNHPGPPRKGPPIWVWILAGLFGFCLVGVIAAALLMRPVFDRAKIAAQKTKTITNAKQHALGLLLYASDHDDFLPRVDWTDSIDPYIEDPSAFTSVAAGPGNEVRHDFAMLHTLAGVSLSEIFAPAEDYMTFESKENAPNQTGGVELVPIPGRYAHNSGGFASCVTFCDGHVKYVVDEVFEKAKSNPKQSGFNWKEE